MDPALEVLVLSMLKRVVWMHTDKEAYDKWMAEHTETVDTPYGKLTRMKFPLFENGGESECNN